MFLWYTALVRLDTSCFAYVLVDGDSCVNCSCDGRLFNHDASLETVNARQVVRVTHSGPADFSGLRLHIGVSHRHMGKMLPWKLLVKHPGVRAE